MSEAIAFGMGLMLMLVLLCGGAYQWGWTRAIAESRKLRHFGVELDNWHDYDELEHRRHLAEERNNEDEDSVSKACVRTRTASSAA